MGEPDQRQRAASEVRWLRRSVVFLAFVSVGLASALVVALSLILPQQQFDDHDIAFPMKVFLFGPTEVSVSGTLVDDWLAYKNNTVSIFCVRKECNVVRVEQDVSNHVRIDGPWTYPVTRWTEDEVVASDNQFCFKLTITLDRKTKVALWVETPIDQTEIECRNVDQSIRKATIEDSPFWRRMKDNK
jgi:hypothetical protein